MEKLIRRGLRFMRAGPDYVNNNGDMTKHMKQPSPRRQFQSYKKDVFVYILAYASTRIWISIRPLNAITALFSGINAGWNTSNTSEVMIPK